MVWFKSAEDAVEENHSEQSKKLQKILMKDPIKEKIEGCSCYLIDTLSEEWTKFIQAFSCEEGPKLLLVKNNEKNIELIYENIKRQKFINDLSLILDSYLPLKTTYTDINQPASVGSSMCKTKEARIKFVLENSSCWSSSYDKYLSFSHIRHDVAQRINHKTDEFFLETRFPNTHLGLEQDQETIEQLSLFPSCVIYITTKSQHLDQEKDSYILSFYSYVKNLLSFMFGIIYYFTPKLTSIPKIEVEVPRDSLSTESSEEGRIKKFGNPQDKNDDEEKRKTDNGNTTLL
ncbi:hypothetical protein HZS_3888, partial [Henneguya salminicola]